MVRAARQQPSEEIIQSLDKLSPLIVIENGKRALCQVMGCSGHPKQKPNPYCPKHMHLMDKLQDTLSGSEPPYTPEVWNGDIAARMVHNCFAYSLNIFSRILVELCRNKNICNTHQPGEISKWPAMDKKTCPNLIARILGDGQYTNNGEYKEGQYIPADYDTVCPQGTSMIAFIVDTKNDYHVLRRDSTGRFSHKGGQGPVTDLDALGHYITDVRRANFNYHWYSEPLNYTHFCGYFCISRSIVHAGVPKGGRRYRATRRTQKKNKTRLLRQKSGK